VAKSLSGKATSRRLPRRLALALGQQSTEMIYWRARLKKKAPVRLDNQLKEIA
jgi:hypothetical protein